MSINKYKQHGWHYESSRHSLAAKGIKTKINYAKSLADITRQYYSKLPLFNPENVGEKVVVFKPGDKALVVFDKNIFKRKPVIVNIKRIEQYKGYTIDLGEVHHGKYGTFIWSRIRKGHTYIGVESFDDYDSAIKEAKKEIDTGHIKKLME